MNDKGAPGLVAKARIPAMPVRSLLRYWPLPVAPGARSWIDDNIFAGAIGPLEAQTNFAPGMLDQDILPEDALKLTFGMRDVEGNYVTGLTHATEVNGTAILTGDTFSARFHLRAASVRSSRAAGSALIPNLHVHGTVGEFTVHVDGAMPDVMALIDMKPLNYPTRFGIDPKTTNGQASTDLVFKVPMLADLPVDDVGISGEGAGERFRRQPGQACGSADGAVNFDIDNDHLHQAGQVNLADSRLTVDWTEDFKTAGPVTTRLDVKGMMTEAARQRAEYRPAAYSSAARCR